MSRALTAAAMREAEALSADATSGEESRLGAKSAVREWASGQVSERDAELASAAATVLTWGASATEAALLSASVVVRASSSDAALTEAVEASRRGDAPAAAEALPIGSSLPRTDAHQPAYSYSSVPAAHVHLGKLCEPRLRRAAPEREERRRSYP